MAEVKELTDEQHEKTRPAFEGWVVEQNLYSRDEVTKRNVSGQYFHIGLEHLWDRWKQITCLVVPVLSVEVTV